LHLDNDPQNRNALEQQHDEIGAVLGWLDVRELRRVDPYVRIRRQGYAQSVAQELRRKGGSIAEEQQQRFVQLRRHAQKTRTRPRGFPL
jgi:hypothetical protein